MLFKKDKVLVTSGDMSILTQTLPLMKAYAKRNGADLLVENEKLHAIYKALEKYERVLYLSDSVLVSKNAPSIFDEVPVGKIGLFNEGVWKNRSKYNTDVLVADKSHRDIFIRNDFVPDGLPIYDLSHHWNRTHATNIIGEDTFLSHFINFEKSFSLAIKENREKWEASNWTGERNIAVYCSGGMGDQIATIPVVEYFAELHPKYKISIHTPFNEVFEHLSSEQIKVIGLGDPPPKYALKMGTSKIDTVTGVCTHATDYHSISLLRRQLPLNRRRIQYPAKKLELPSKTVVIHAGKSGWKSKEAPRQFWYDIIMGLKEKGFPVALIGKKDWTGVKKGYGAHYFPDCDFDFTDRTLAETADVIRSGWFLLTNDSMPVHLAGAYDNWIGLVTIAKRPEFILPYRYNRQDYKTISWTGTPLWEVVREPIVTIPGHDFSWSDWHEGMKWPDTKEIVSDILARSQAVRHLPVKETSVCSNQTAPAMLP